VQLPLAFFFGLAADAAHAMAAVAAHLSNPLIDDRFVTGRLKLQLPDQLTQYACQFDQSEAAATANTLAPHKAGGLRQEPRVRAVLPQLAGLPQQLWSTWRCDGVKPV